MPIVLMTDFGNAGNYVGTLKGVLAKITPDEPVLDLTHEIPPFDILQGALTLYQSYQFFPDDSIFVVVVDPGVGSPRKPILAKTDHYTFIAPDNGVLTWVLAYEKNFSLFHLDNPEYHLPVVSETFHGRDIFAPVAAHWSKGVDLLKLGSPLDDYLKLEECFPTSEGDQVLGKVISIDRFGNAITNLHRQLLESSFPQRKFTLRFKGKRRKPLEKLSLHYAEGKVGEIMMLYGSSNFLEISVNQGSAAEKLKINRGQEVILS